MKVSYRKKTVSLRKHFKGTCLPRRIEDGKWVVDTENGVEWGDLLWVLDCFCHDGLHYNYNNADYPDEPDHAHSFDEVLEAVLSDPEHFSIEKYLDQYSVQERGFLYNLRDLLILAKQEKRIFRQEETAPRGPVYYQRELEREKKRHT